MVDTTTTIVWHAFLQSVPEDLRDQLNACLQPELSEEMQKLQERSFDISQGVTPLEEEFENIHASWFTSFFRSLSENDAKLFLSVLSEYQLQTIKKYLLFSNTLPHPTSVGKAYLRSVLLQKIVDEPLIPIEALSNDPMKILLDLNLTEIHSLIELLSMHDLAVEIRQIIETAKLKEIYAVLTKAQTTYLKTLLHKKGTVSFRKMGLANWKGDKNSLRAILLQRGINRIAKALYGRSPSLLWYVAHRLDSEKAKMLIELCKPLDHSQAAVLLAHQITELIHAIKQHNPPETL